jgi:ketosteroid isomerase-like protein
MADDIVVPHPYCGVIDGKDAVRTFMGHVLGDVHAEFDKHAPYSTIELKVSGDLAYERGTLLQLLTPKSGGPIERDEGMNLWIYKRHDGLWQIARIVGSFTPADEPADRQAEGTC